MVSDIPSDFGVRFLDWFRARTESAWAALPNDRPEDILAKHVATGAGNCAWQHGSRWLNGLTKEQISEIERAQRLTFPPDYRLFLQRMHTVDRPRLCSGYLESGMRPESEPGIIASVYSDQYEQYMVLEEEEGFHNWLIDAETGVQPASLWQGIQFDVKHNGLWRTEWGERPLSLEARKEHVRALVEAAPKLVHLFGSKYLLAEPAQVGNPILSISQSDIVIYGANLRDYLLFEFAELLGLTRSSVEREVVRTILSRRTEYAAIPFWGVFCA